MDKDEKLNVPNLQILGQDNSGLFADAQGKKDDRDLPAKLAQHPTFSKLFQKNKLSFGLVAPFKGYPNTPIPDAADLIANAQKAEQAGFDALWIRDVPFYDPYFGDVGQGLDPSAVLGALAIETSSIALGSAGLILPERSPIHIAQLAASIDRMSHHRFLLGLVSGDRKNEFMAFGRDWRQRSDIFREGWELTRTLLTKPDHPHFSGQYYDKLNGTLNLVPKPDSEYPIPMVAIGRCRQELEWLANEPDAWIWHGIDEDETSKVVAKLSDLNEDGNWHPFGYQNFVELLPDPDAPCRLFNRIYLRGGARSLAAFWKKQRQQGLSHIVINLKPTSLSLEECLDDFNKYIFDQVNED